jgi:hypothetical protein
MKNRKNLMTAVTIGEKYNYLTVVSNPYKQIVTARKLVFVECICDCGKQIRVMVQSLIRGTTKSCKCKRLIFTDRKKAYHLRLSFNGMHKRCGDLSVRYYKRYMLRGITVCERWSDFRVFYEDMQENWSAGLTLDRIDGSKGYSPENCRWATWEVQQRNKENIKMTQEMADAIRSEDKLSTAAIGRKYGISQPYACRIKNFDRWK